MKDKKMYEIQILTYTESIYWRMYATVFFSVYQA